MNGQSFESSVYVKGSRKRTESGGIMGVGADVATIEQCDLKQDVKVNDKKKLYAIEPFNNGDTTATPAVKSTAPKTKTPVTRGGTLTYISKVTDTGERKQMFGITARHVKSSMTVEASPDACSKQDMKIETDGWYIDLPAFSCPMTMRPTQIPRYESPQRGGCEDKFIFRTTGGGKMGFPLTETRTIAQGSAQMSFTQTTETLEFSKATLEDALFAVPEGYARVENSQDLYGRPDFTAMMGNPKGIDNNVPAVKSPSASQPAKAKKPGIIRIGVLPPTNRGESVSLSNMQAFLVQKLKSGNVEGVAINSDADARAYNCDYLLSSDFSKLKQTTASKIGGIFGKVINTDASSVRKYEVQVDFKLVSLLTGKTTLQDKVSAKTESEADRAVEGTLVTVAAMVIPAAK